MSGKLEKLTIESYLTPFYIVPVTKYTVMFNPTNYSRSHSVTYDKGEQLNSEGSPMIFNRIDPEEFALEFLVDGTGTSAPVEDVFANVEKFLSVCGRSSDQLSRPSFLKVFWGSLVFKGVLKNATTNYTLFAPDGTPLRARIKASFCEHRPDILGKLLKNEGVAAAVKDTGLEEAFNLTKMVYDNYGDPTLYLEVAKVNGMKSIRKATKGSKIKLPKIK